LVWLTFFFLSFLTNRKKEEEKKEKEWSTNQTPFETTTTLEKKGN